MRGGKRQGAGRKRGSPNKASAAREKAVSASGITPLDYMLRVMRNRKTDPYRRDEMAKAAAPYVHPKLSAVDFSGKLDVDAKVEEVRRTIVDPKLK